MSFTTTPVTTTGEELKSPIAVNLNESKEVSSKTEEKPTETTEKKDLFSEKFAMLSKKERKIFKEREESKLLRASIEKKEQELAERERRLKEWESINDPIKALQAKGFTYDQATEWVLNNGKPTPEQEIGSVKKEIEEFKKQQEEERRLAAERQKEALLLEQKAVVDTFKSSIEDFITEKAEDYALTKLFDQTQLVYDTIEEYYERTKKILSIEEGANLVEKYLEDKIQEANNSPKYKKRQAPNPTGDNSEDGFQHTNQKTQTRTLTNNQTSTGPSFLSPKVENDRMARALAALGGK